MELVDNIDELLSSCVTALVDNKDDVVVDVRRDGDSNEEGKDVIIAEIRVNKDDVGKVIGRQGRTIKSLRTLARALGSKHGVRTEVEIIEED